MSQHYTVVVIGGGPAGYVAAIRCAQLGLSVACIDDWQDADGKAALGGTCLNVGCIPSKALLESSERYWEAANGLQVHGVNTGKVSLDLAVMQARKNKIVAQLTGGIRALFKSNGITHLHGRGRLLEGGRVEFTPHAKGRPEVVQADKVILASGSRPIDLDAAPVDGNRIVDSSGALEFTQVPRNLVIIGAGAIGLELGSVWSRLGSKVTLVEAQADFLPIADDQLARMALKEFSRQGLDIRLGARVVATRTAAKHVNIDYQIGEQKHQLKADHLVVAVGRQPRTEDVAAPAAGLLLDERGFIHVDESCTTNLPGIFAIGDAVRGPMLAHKGSEEGVAVAEAIASGRAAVINHERIPAVIYTHPEIAWVGSTEQALRAAGHDIRIGTFPFAASGRALAMEHTTGLVKIIADRVSDQVLGVHIIGPGASELIAEAVLAMEFSASSEDIARTIHAHPTLAEALHESALAVDGRAIHMVNRKPGKNKTA